MTSFSEQNNQSLSILTFVPVIDDDGKYLTCRAENPSIPDSALEDKWRLNVQYIPVVTLKMGSTLNPDDIKEGDDVYFECNVRANPKAHKLSWFHNNQEIFQNVTAGVIMSDQSLVLQNVARSTAGEYTCMAANLEGKGTSNPVKLVVRCKYHFNLTRFNCLMQPEKVGQCVSSNVILTLLYSNVNLTLLYSNVILTLLYGRNFSRHTKGNDLKNS
ncbi:hypothetical protein NQ317_007407 [Molorchus minor]|uniref:Ig-like domain-containing protein n=1 Tax=Molorchus minor TaxID=1323400 RepID=A0ABQ9JVF2_9CUCU|nr:hypothetical protein NQ317_007407 [Molorchus minor]